MPKHYKKMKKGSKKYYEALAEHLLSLLEAYRFNRKKKTAGMFPPGYEDLIQYSSVDQLSEEKRAEIGTYADYVEDVKGGEKGYQKYVDEESGTGVEDVNILSKIVSVSPIYVSTCDI